MRKQDFIRKRKEFEKRFKRNDWIYSSVFILLLIANVIVVSGFDVLDGLPDYASWIYLVLFFAFLFCNIFMVNVFHKSQIKKSGLKCHSCKEPLLGEQADVAVATNNCPMCGNSAFY